jgi:hypothetical protein
MDPNILIDSFVETINSTSRESLLQEDVPAFLREGDPDEYGYFNWKVCKTDCRKWIDPFEQKVAKRLPSSYRSFISRYAFPAFQLGPIFFFGNTGDDFKWELSKRIFKDEFMSSRLLQSWYLQIGNPHKFNYDPICFDTKKGMECPIVQIDHEELLCNSRIKVIREIAPSFSKFVQDFVGWSN